MDNQICVCSCGQGIFEIRHVLYKLYYYYYYYKNIILDIKTTVGDGFQFLLVPTESTATPPSDEFDDLLNDSISHTFLDSLIYVMFPVKYILCPLIIVTFS